MGRSSGDKPVDDVDNKVTRSGESGGKSDISGGKITPSGGAAGAESPGSGDAPRGADLAREALRAAQASAKARGRGRPTSSRGSAVMARRRKRWSGARPDERDPQALGNLVSRLAADRGWSEKLAGGQVFSQIGRAHV